MVPTETHIAETEPTGMFDAEDDEPEEALELEDSDAMDPDSRLRTEAAPAQRRSIRSIEAQEDTSSEPTDFTPYLEQLAPSTRKILKDEFHANFIHLIRPRSPTAPEPPANPNPRLPTPAT